MCLMSPISSRSRGLPRKLSRRGSRFMRDKIRNRIVHDYEGVNLRLIWEIVSDDMPALRCELNGMKKRFGESGQVC
ncbi:MAG: DUF86 domain-containing protein [Selenomonas sp.]